MQVLSNLIKTMNAPPQHKQRYYYIFWSIATIAVVFGQINVSNAYNRMSNSLEQVLLND